MRSVLMHAGLSTSLLATLLGGLLSVDVDAHAELAECTTADTAPETAPTPTPTLGRGLLHRRSFFGDEPLAAPWVSLDDVVRDDDVAPGTGLLLHAEAGGTLSVTPPSGLPAGAASRVRLVVAARAPMTVELELHDAQSGTRLYHTLALGTGISAIDTDLVDFRYARGRVPSAARATRWGLRFVDGGALELRAFELWRDDELSHHDRELAALRDDFDEPGTVRSFRRGPFVVLTDAPQFEPGYVLDALEAMHARTRALLPSLPASTRPIPLLVFADDAEYRRFWSRISSRTGAEVGPGKGDEGYTWMGIATASYSAMWPLVRPTFVHEASHALLERSFGLAAQGSWLFEGLAVIEQLEVSAQDLTPVYRDALTRRDAASTLGELTDGRPIKTARYWQAAMFMQWLTADSGRRAALDAALGEMAHRGSSDLRPLAARYFGAELDALSVEFWTWAWLAHGG